jgi:hypothetical protein
MVSGRLDTLNQRFGPQTLEEEIASETEVQIPPASSAAKTA